MNIKNNDNTITKPREIISNALKLSILLNINRTLIFVSKSGSGDILTIPESMPGRVSEGIIAEENIKNRIARDIDALIADS